MVGWQVLNIAPRPATMKNGANKTRAKEGKDMSVRIYIKQDPSLKIVPVYGRGYHLLELGELRIVIHGIREGPGSYWSADHLDDFFPEEFGPYIERVTFHGTVYHEGARALGVYRFAGAEAIVEATSDAGIYNLRISGSTLESVRLLHNVIRAGTILPIESWEKEQIRRRATWAIILAVLRLKRANAL